MSIPSNKASKYTNPKFTELKGEIDNSKIICPMSATDRTRKKQQRQRSSEQHYLYDYTHQGQNTHFHSRKIQEFLLLLSTIFKTSRKKIAANKK